MSKTRIKQSVGYFIMDIEDDGRAEFFIEQDYGSNPYGDVGLYYRNKSNDNLDGGICYVSTVPGGIIAFGDPKFREYAYEYKEVLDICKGNEGMAECVLELAIGQSIEAIYDELKEDDDEAED